MKNENLYRIQGTNIFQEGHQCVL